MEIVIPHAVIGKLSEMIAQKAFEEISSVYNFTRDFDFLEKELGNIKVCLAYADSLAAQDEPVNRWLHRFRDVAWDTQDIVEECAVRPLYTSSVTQSCACNPCQLLFRYRMAKRIQEIKDRIRSITESGNQLKLFRDVVPSGSEQPSSSTPRKENRLIPIDSHPVGIDTKVQHLISMIDESTGPVIAVVAMGGAGKTFLVRNVFDRIHQGYKYKIWLSISQSYSVHQLQINLASCKDEIDGKLNDEEKTKDEVKLMDKLKDVSEDRGAELIHEALQGKKYLIVLDDVWKVARENNIITSLGLPVGPNSQGKVVVTTRNGQFCENLGALPYKMELLSEQDSRQLFSAYAFGGEPPDHLQEIARKVEKKCGGLPLALKVIGASLSGCTQIRLWESKLDQLTEIGDLREADDPNSDSVMKILKMSYDSLPPSLKVCFSYLSFFPEDERIDAEYLINLWIVEGFIPQGEPKWDEDRRYLYQWDKAWSYLYQLANLCLLEVEEDDYLVKHCKIHDLLLNLAIAISKEHQRIFSVGDAFRSAERNLLQKKEIDAFKSAKRNLLHKEKIEGIQSRVSCPRSLRTLSLYKTPIEKIEKKFVSPMRLLRILDLRSTNISTLPVCVGKLQILKLLNLSSTRIEKVPICVRSLKSLLFLDLSYCKLLQGLPKWINKLKCLEHLNIIGCKPELLAQMPKGISELVALRVLRSSVHLKFSVEEDTFLRLKDFSKLTSLQELSIEVQDEIQLNSFEDAFAHLLKMRHLSIKSSLSSAPNEPPNLSAMSCLQTLKLQKFAVPNWVCELTDLVELVLVNCECSNYPELQLLPNLRKLILDNNKSCEKLPEAFGKPSGFPKLRLLTIQSFSELEKLPDLEDGAMAVLEQFYVGLCPRLNEVPKGLQCLTKLRNFNYSGDPDDGLDKGSDFWNNIRASINDHKSLQVEISVTIT